MMKTIKSGLAAGILLLFSPVSAAGERAGPQSPGQTDVSGSAARKRLVESVAAVVETNYVFPDVAAKVAAALRERLRSGAYDDITTAERLTRALTEDMRSVSRDFHLGVVENKRLPPGAAAAAGSGSAPSPAGKTIPLRNFGFQQALRLPGNIGCLVIDEWAELESEGESAAWKTALAALRFVSHSQALIIDLRDNFGGREEMAVGLLSYVFDRPTHLLTKHDRGKQGQRETWTTQPAEEGNLARIPLFVLTSRHTVSGGEMFAYVLKNRKRAAIVGEKTRGAAHYTHLFPLQDLPFTVAVPVGTAIDPATGTNWEGTGVEPDIAVEAGKALDAAYREALGVVLASDAPALLKQEARWALPEVQARLEPPPPTVQNTQDYEGAYGKHRVTAREGFLFCALNQGEAKRIVPLGKDLFAFDDKGLFYVRLQFFRDGTGAVSGLRLVYDTGQQQDVPKNK